MHIVQFVAESLIECGTYLLASTAFAAIFMTTRDGLFHLAQGGLVLLAVGSFNRVVHCGMAISPALVIGAMVGAVTGLLIEWVIYRPLRRQSYASSVMLLASFGTMLVLERSTSMWMGTEPLYLPSHTRITERFQVLGASLTREEVIVGSVAILGSACLGLAFIGRAGGYLVAIRQSPLLYDWRGGHAQRFLCALSLGSGAVASIALMLQHLEHRIVLSSAAMGHLLPAFVITITASSLGNRAAAIIPATRRSGVVERAAFVGAMFSTSLVLALAGRALTLYGEPRWKQSLFLLLAIGSLVLFTDHRGHAPDEAANP